MTVTLKVRAISTVRSVEPSLTTMISSISGLPVRTPRTSPIVFSSLYAAMMAEVSKQFTSKIDLRGRLQRAHHNTGEPFALPRGHETHARLCDAANRAN